MLFNMFVSNLYSHQIQLFFDLYAQKNETLEKKSRYAFFVQRV